METLQTAKGVIRDVEAFPLIGMGAFHYIDFLFANKILGTCEFTSIEHDEAIIPRCEYNKPFDNLVVKNMAASEYVSTVGFENPAIVWFDYESTISVDLKEDILALSGALKPGSFLFLTATAELPSHFGSVKGLPKRFKVFKEEFDPLVPFVGQHHLTLREFPLIAPRVMGAFLHFGFSGRKDGRFIPYLRLVYKDSTWMMTVGGYFGPDKQVRE